MDNSHNPFMSLLLEKNGKTSVQECTKACEILKNFLNDEISVDLDVGLDLIFHVEEIVHISKQNDLIFTQGYLGIPKSARLTMHFDYELFKVADEVKRTQLYLTASYYLLNYWQNYLKIPKGVCLNELIIPFKKFLEEHQYMLSKDAFEKISIKPIISFKSQFVSGKVVQGVDFREEVDKIEEKINDILYQKNYHSYIKGITVYYNFGDFGSDSGKLLLSEKIFKRFNTDGTSGTLDFDIRIDSNNFKKLSAEQKKKEFIRCLTDTIETMNITKSKYKDFHLKELSEDLKCLFDYQ